MGYTINRNIELDDDAMREIAMAWIQKTIEDKTCANFSDYDDHIYTFTTKEFYNVKSKLMSAIDEAVYMAGYEGYFKWRKANGDV